MSELDRVATSFVHKCFRCRHCFPCSLYDDSYDIFALYSWPKLIDRTSSSLSAAVIAFLYIQLFPIVRQIAEEEEIGLHFQIYFLLVIFHDAEAFAFTEQSEMVK